MYTDTVSSFFNNHKIDGNRVLLACSGGIDSMVLLHTMLSLGHRPSIAHCNFNLRAQDSDEDENFVVQYCKALGLAVFVKHFDTSTYASESGISTQMAARDLRYTFFKELLRTEDLDYVATAHHADDALETILLNLGRGSGLMGMTGIRSMANNLIRPLLSFSKREIQEYAEKHKLNWREDASNKKENYQRNYIRHKVMPPLRQGFPNFESSSKKSLQYLAEDRQLFENLIGKELEMLILREDENEILNIVVLKSRQSARALLRYWLMPFGPFDVESIHNSLNGESGAYFKAGDFELLKDRNTLILKAQEKNTDHQEFWIDIKTTTLSDPIALKTERLDESSFQITDNPKVAALDYDKLQFPLKLRHWKTGDSFYPLGMKGAKKLSDFFIDRKFSRFEKDQAWLLCSGNDIVWIVNERLDDRYKLSNTTKTVYFVRSL